MKRIDFIGSIANMIVEGLPDIDCLVEIDHLEGDDSSLKITNRVPKEENEVFNVLVYSEYNDFAIKLHHRKEFSLKKYEVSFSHATNNSTNEKGIKLLEAALKVMKEIEEKCEITYEIKEEFHFLEKEERLIKKVA